MFTLADSVEEEHDIAAFSSSSSSTSSSPSPSACLAASDPPLSSSSPYSSPLSTPVFPFTQLTITFPIVGRKHYSHLAVSSPSSLPPATLLVVREPHNPRDPLALKVYHSFVPTPSLLPLGHVPARLSSSLSPLLDLTSSHFTATVIPSDTDEPTDDQLTASLTLHSPSLIPPQHKDRVARHVRDLLAYVEWRGADHTHRFIRNFQLITSSTLERFSHLFTDDEREMVDSFLRLSPASQHLYCRLMQRKQTPSPLMSHVIHSLSSSSASSPSVCRWFQVNSLHYNAVPDLDSSITELLQPPPSPDPIDCHLPPLLTSPCKLRPLDVTTFANFTLSSPFSTSTLHYPSGDDATPPPSPYKPPPVKRQRGGDDFIETSMSSSLAPADFYSSLFDSMTSAQIKEFCSALSIRLRSTSLSSLKSALLSHLNNQRTLTGQPLLSDPRILRTLHSLFGTFVRLSPPFLLLCQRVYRLFFLSEDVSHRSIASAASPMVLEDLGRAKWAKPSPLPTLSTSSAACLFPSRDHFLSYDLSLQLLDVMTYAIDDWEAEMRAGYCHTPLALACMEEGWMRLEAERTKPNSSLALPFQVMERVKRMQGHTAQPFLFPTDYTSFFTTFTPSIPASTFLLRFRSTSTYSLVCHHGIAILEREHRYIEAVSLLYRLLCMPWLPKKRGQWWNRLSLDVATHLGEKREAMKVARRGLDDVRVRTGDRVELERRWERLWKDKEGGNGEGLAPHLRWGVPQPTTAKRRVDKVKGKKRRHSTSQIKQEATDGEPPLLRATSSPSSFSSSSITQLTIQGRPLNREQSVKSVFYSPSNEPCSVEELALYHYATLGFKGVHCENSFFLTLFGLLMWDVIWDGRVDGVWVSQYQSAPLDMDEDEWYDARRGQIEERVQQVMGMERVEDEVDRVWWLHYGERCRGVQWDRWSVEEVKDMVRGIGGEGVAGVLSVMSRDYHHWGGGLPDLFLWRAGVDEVEMGKGVKRRLEMEEVIVISSDDEGEETVKREGGERVEMREKKNGKKCNDQVRLVEVKGPRDRLSPQQLAWLHVLAPYVPVEVCYVREDFDKL